MAEQRRSQISCVQFAQRSTIRLLEVLMVASIAAGILAGPASASHNGEMILDDQIDGTCGTGGISSQVFLNDQTANTEAADDFVVPSGAKWRVTAVQVSGGYLLGPGPAPSVNVFIYADMAGVPGMLVHSTLAVVPTSGQNTGNFLIDLMAPPTLEPGTYWVSVQVNMDFTLVGQWHWDEREMGTNSPFVFRQVSDADCATFAPVGPPCFDDPPAGTGLCFSLEGRDLNAAPLPLLNSAGMLLLVVILTGIAALRMRDSSVRPKIPS